MGLGCPWLPLVQPNASKPEAWRASASCAYGGNLLSVPVAYGQLCMAAESLYVPGASAHQVYYSTASAAGVYLPGAAAHQVGC